MSTIGRFVKSTLVGGILFVVPLVVIALLVREGVHMTAQVFRPIARLFPTERIAGLVVDDVVAIVVLLALCFALGLFVETSPGRAVRDRLERFALRRVPGFTFFKSIAYGVAGEESRSGLSAALAQVEDAWVPAFVVERHTSGLSTVFIPSAPTPAA